MKRIKSNQISRQVRPIFEIQPIRVVFGILIALITITFTLISPSSAASDYSQPTIANLTLSANAVQLTTIQAVRNPLINSLIVNQGFHSGHLGVDLDGEQGDPVYPVMQGQVFQVLNRPYDYGQHVIIDHSQNIYSLYAHLSNIMVQPGQTLDTNTVIGQVGSTGHSSGSHLHLEIIDQNNRINPLTFIDRSN